MVAYVLAKCFHGRLSSRVWEVAICVVAGACLSEVFKRIMYYCMCSKMSRRFQLRRKKTKEFLQSTSSTYDEALLLSFFDEKYRDALTFCGSHSGRDHDKAKEAGLTPVFEDGYTYFAEASLVLFCEKKYADDLKGENFTDKSIIGKCYPSSDFHRMYIGKITKCIKKQSD